MTRQMLHFKLVHVSAPERLLTVYTSNSCILQKMRNSAPSGHTFWWVAEFGETTAISGDDATFFSSNAPYRVANRQLAQKKKKKNTYFGQSRLRSALALSIELHSIKLDCSSIRIPLGVIAVQIEWGSVGLDG